MECFKVAWRELGNGFHSLFFPEVRYKLGEEFDDGPYFAFRTFQSAQDYAVEFSRYFAPVSSISDLVILRVAGNPIIPQPKRVPALYAAQTIIEHWRSIVLENPELADELFQTHLRYFYEVPPEWVILRNFRIIEVASAFYPEGLFPVGIKQHRVINSSNFKRTPFLRKSGNYCRR